MATTWDYEGRRAIVTGAASGMGRATAVALVAAGAEVHALDQKPVEVAGVASSHLCDLTDSDSIAAAFDAVEGQIDVVFGCAGLPHTFPALQIVDVGWLGAREVIERSLERMPIGGSIATIASIASMGWRNRREELRELIARDRLAAHAWLEAHPEFLADGYNLTKECIAVYTADQAPVLAGRGIRINCTSPGDTATPMRDAFIEFFGAEAWAGLPLPLGRPSQPEEQAAALLFLNSDAASYISGVNLVVDGAATPSMGIVI